MFGREGRPTPLGQAFSEYGRIAKTLHLLRVVGPVDDTYRRQMNRQLTVQESRHKLARDICHGKRGQIMQAYRTGQEDQLGALGLVLTPQCRGQPDTRTRPTPTGRTRRRATRYWTRTSRDCPRTSTPISTAWAATASAPPSPRRASCPA
jgi:hypothetical protein